MRFLYPGGGQSSAYGIITAPNHKGIPLGIIEGKPWGGDLGCSMGPDYVKKINLSAVANWLPTMEPYKPQCLWIAGGDVVCDAVATLDAYEEFRWYFNGWPVAYVAQNGAEDLPIPEDCAAVFIGGDTEWKCSMAAVSVIKRAQEMGKLIHVGRVNWGKRYRLFRMLEGSDLFTCDGNRARYDGREKTLAAWGAYEAQAALINL